MEHHLSGDNTGISGHIRTLEDLSHFTCQAEQPFFCPSPLTDLESGNETITIPKEAARVFTGKGSGWAFRLPGRSTNPCGKMASPPVVRLSGAVLETHSWQR